MSDILKILQAKPMAATFYGAELGPQTHPFVHMGQVNCPLAKHVP